MTLSLNFLKSEAISGFVLFITALFAIIVNNSPLQNYYQNLIHFQINFLNINLPVQEWINQGGMTLFFFLLGLEIKREIVVGELNSLRKITLPAIAALGGMLIPALIYIAFNWNDHLALQGWAIPTATDVAFALGVLSLLPKKVPVALKMFLTALAIFDDVGAIIIIAIFYTSHIKAIYLLSALAVACLLFLFNYLKVKSLFPYLVLIFILWYLVLHSGVHAVIAGIVGALAIPMNGEKQSSPLIKLENFLGPWVAFLVLPIFSFANAGFSFQEINLHTWLSPITLGIALGLFMGKQIGVFFSSWLAIKFRLGHMSSTMTWKNLYGVALLCGIGFTMSLFIGTLAFTNGAASYAASLRLGIFLGSFLSACAGYLILLLV